MVWASGIYYKGAVKEISICDFESQSCDQACTCILGFEVVGVRLFDLYEIIWTDEANRLVTMCSLHLYSKQENQESLSTRYRVLQIRRISFQL